MSASRRAPQPRSQLQPSLAGSAARATDDGADKSTPQPSGLRGKPFSSAASAARDEEQAVLKFYNLRNILVDKWEEESPQDEHEASETGQQSPQVAAEEVDLSDPLGIKPSIIGRNRRKSLNPAQYEKLLVASKNFEPKAFLKLVHGKTSFRDVQNGSKYLAASVDRSNELMRDLVKQHFAKFVSAKGTIDAFYLDIKANNIVTSETRGLDSFDKALEGLSTSAQSLYTPLLERRRKAERIRATLFVLEQWKFFFNLPCTLKESISKGRFDAVVRDYNKGKYLMSSSFASKASMANERNELAAADAADTMLPEHYLVVFEQVWFEVESIIRTFRGHLFQQLEVSSNPLESQERILSHLVDLDPEEDPVKFYLDNQYQWIVLQLFQAYGSHVAKLQALVNAESRTKLLPEVSIPPPKPHYILNTMNEDEEAQQAPMETPLEVDFDPIRRSNGLSLPDFQKALSTVQSQAFERFFNEDLDFQMWKSTLVCVQSLCKVMRKSMQDFWKACRIYCEDRIQKSRGAKSSEQGQRIKRRADVKKMTQCQAMIKHIAETYSSLVTNLLFVNVPLTQINRQMRHSNGSANVVSPSSWSSYVDPLDQSRIEDVTKLSPQSIPFAASFFLLSHPLTACHWISKIMGELVRCYGDVRNMRIGGGTTIEENILRRVGSAADSVKARCVDVICDGLLYESRRFSDYEDWTLEPDSEGNAQDLLSNQEIRTVETTHLVKLFYRFSKVIIRCLQRIASAPVSSQPQIGDEIQHLSSLLPSAENDSVVRSITPVTSSVGSRAKSSEPPPVFSGIQPVLLQRVVTSYFDSAAFFLDGCEWLATRCYMTRSELSGLHHQKIDRFLSGQEDLIMVGHHKLSARDVSISKGDETHVEGVRLLKKKQMIDPSRVDTRILVVLSNLDFLRSSAFPKLNALLELKFKHSPVTEVRILNNTMNHLDALLFDNYVRRKALKISGLVRSGVLYSGLDWAKLTRPIDVRNHVHEILLLFVLSHAEASVAAKGLIGRVMSELLRLTALDLLASFREIDVFGRGGAMQATLETEFLHQTLGAFETRSTKELFSLIYATIERGTVDETPTADTPSTDGTVLSRQQMLESVKDILQRTREATALQFLCFRQAE
ncbi:exocyst complex component Sec5-domain-containing protein [Zopfochytrium polystomum]|nr:exocyst complex component Sec5-domain-containing protein [Zopfochytrium polystomum]